MQNTLAICTAWVTDAEVEVTLCTIHDAAYAWSNRRPATTTVSLLQVLLLLHLEHRRRH